MDSMRSLNRSLPNSRETSEDLNSAFKAAAISVTNLYKKAITGQAQSRSAGYQDALDDLLSFLDRENLGLQDGEGWLVRQWATKLLDDRPAVVSTANKEEQHASDSEEEKEIEKEKSPSPAAQDDSSPIHQSTERQPEISKPAEKTVLTLPTSDTFTFQSSHAYPRDVEMQVTETLPQRREVSPRTTRHRKANKQKSLSAKGLGSSGGGSKRKLPFGEFFDISDLTESKDEGRKPAVRRKLA